MAKSNKESFIVELKLHVEPWQRHILNTRFELARKLFNTTLSYALKQFKAMKESKTYRKQLHLYRELKRKVHRTSQKGERSPYQEAFNTCRDALKEIQKSFGLTEYGLHGYIKKHQHNAKKHIDSQTAQKMASTVWRSIQTIIFQGASAHFKKFGNLTSVEGKTNASGIRFKDNAIHWNKLVLSVKIRKKDLFVQESLASHRVKYCRIVKKVIRGNDSYYVQLVMDGIPPTKRIHTTGEFRHQPSSTERVGIDIGTSTVAVASSKKVWVQPLAPKLLVFEKEKARLQRKLDRSRRSMNPDYFNEDGTVKRGIKLIWKNSKNYFKTLFQLKELIRKRSVYLKNSHGSIANQIVALGTEIFVEHMNFKALALRTKETRINKKGKFQRKKRFGKSIGTHAPAMLITMIDQKLKYLNRSIQKVNTRTFKASQYNHITDTYKKKKLHQRWSLIGSDLVQRDLYSAFLLMNSTDDLKQTDRDHCILTFENFIRLHNKHVEQLREQDHLPSSIGIKKVS